MRQFPIKQQGFVLVVSLIFLVIMTVLAVTSIQRATLDEKVSGNLRAQNIAFQAAESALRFCQRDLTLMGLPLDAGVVNTIANNIPIVPYPPPDPAVNPPPLPTKWVNLTDWTSTTSITLPANTIPLVVAQPQCMIEQYTMRGGLKNEVRDAYVITARAVGTTANAVVWLQETIRVGID